MADPETANPTPNSIEWGINTTFFWKSNSGKYL
jgi:hypothetical protein